MATYQPTSIENYPGRSSKEALYIREAIRFSMIDAIATCATKSIALLGYCCDEGVRRNQGRVGAVEGPNAIRQQFGKLANHIKLPIVDFGNLQCDDADLEGIQHQLAEVVSQLQTANYFPIILGGGHDIAYGHFMGLQKAYPKQKIGIINFDAHLDLREPQPQGNSGTPFYQIAQENNPFFYLPIGIREESNHIKLLQRAAKHQVNVIPFSECQEFNLRNVLAKIDAFAQQVDKLYITIDLDGFSSAYAPGVSAPHPIGLTPSFVMFCLTSIIKTEKVIAVDFAEMNPKYDQDGVTARLAASLIYYLIRQLER